MKKRNSTSTTKGWLADQIKKAQADMAKWPSWMRKAARWEGDK